MITVYYTTKKPRTNVSGLDDSSGVFGKTALFWHNSRPHSWQPATDIYETDDRIVMLIEIAGIKENDLTLTASQNYLLIQGVRNPPYDSPRSIHQMEILYGEFSVELQFSIPVDYERIEAVYQQGFLRITLPKSQPRNIPLNKE